MKTTPHTTVANPGACRHRSQLPDGALAALHTIQTTKVFPTGHEFFLEGQPPHGIYILYSGRVELSVTDSHGRQMVLGTALPGDVLGLSAVISGTHYEETAVAAIPSQIGFVKSQDFLRFLSRYPEASFWVVQLLSERVTTTLAQLSCIRELPARSMRI
ncbi:MAG TPA: Crp/Fnr family transcriptional regulator [Terriglobia bacterium]|jgi:CRP/FNR family transcriptional regulator|nr:Crp/Fnr family transcriptional regulator [Terriglobia bacterium]